MPDVLHITEACGGGVRRHLELILPALARQGVRTSLLAFGNRFEEDFGQAFARMGIPVRCCPLPGARWNVVRAAVPLIQETIQQWRPDVLHLHAFLAGVAGRFASRLPIVYSPHAFSIHPPVSIPVRWTVRAMERLLAPRTSAWGLVGPAELQDARKLNLPPGRIHLAWNALPEDFASGLLSRRQAREALGLPQDIPVGAAPCRLAPQKGLDCLLQAVSLLPPDIRILIAGDGPLHNQLLATASRLHIQDRILFQGRIPDFRRFLPAFDLVVLPSLYEGLSYALLEALAAGIPVAASDIPANHVTPEDGNLIHFCQPGKPDSLANAMLQALQTKSSPFQPFSLDKQAQTLANLYLSCQKT